MDSSGLDFVSVFVSASTSSLPDSTRLAGDSYSNGRVYTAGLDCRKRLYWTGVYLSKLESSLLGGGLLDLNVLGWVGDVRYANGCSVGDEEDGDCEGDEGCVGDDGCLGERS